MASEGNSTSIVAIVAILIMVALGGFFAYRMGAFGGGGEGHHKTLDINVSAPSTK